VEDDLWPSKTIIIPSKAENCYNKIEFQAFYNMRDIILRIGFDIIPNLHHDPINKSYLSPKSYFVLSKNIISYKK
jgi:hypothetical protein